MKTNVQLKGFLMFGLVMGLMIAYVNFQNSKFGTILLIVSVVLLFIAAYYVGDNTNNKQFERIMKKVGGENLLYVVDGTAAVDIGSLIIHYGLKRKKYDHIFESNNNIFIDVLCALPTDVPAGEGFSCIKNDLSEILKMTNMERVEYVGKTYSFGIHFELQPAKVSASMLQRIQQSLVSILIDKHHLNMAKRYLKTEESGIVYYWEFVGCYASRFVSYSVEDDVWDYDNEDVSYDLSDFESEAIIITENEFEAIYEKVANDETLAEYNR